MIQAARAQVAELTQAAYERAAAAGVLTGGAEVKATVEIPKDTAHGDYASSFAMAGAKALHMAPRAIAQAIVDHMDLTGSYFQKVDIAGPGFLNFTLGPKWYGQVLAQVEQEGPEYGSGSEGKGERVMVEFVSANPTGPMHMGNARGGVLGDTLANVLKRDGWDTWKEFYVNDAGNQIHKFAMSIYARYMQLIGGGGELPLPGGGLPRGRHPGAGPRPSMAQAGDLPGQDLLEEARRDSYGRVRPVREHPQDEGGPEASYGIEYDQWFLESDLHNSGYVEETVAAAHREGLDL